MPTSPFVIGLPLLVFVAGVAAVDIRERRIPNQIVLTGSACALLIAFTGGFGSVADSAGGLVLGLAVLFPAFALGWLGAGDVKLMGAVGSFLGATGLPRALFYSALAGGVLAAVALSARAARKWRSAGTAPRFDTVPYGVAIGLGAVAAALFDPRGEWAGF